MTWRGRQHTWERHHDVIPSMQTVSDCIVLNSMSWGEPRMMGIELPSSPSSPSMLFSFSVFHPGWPAFTVINTQASFFFLAYGMVSCSWVLMSNSCHLFPPKYFHQNISNKSSKNFRPCIPYNFKYIAYQDNDPLVKLFYRVNHNGYCIINKTWKSNLKAFK